MKLLIASDIHGDLDSIEKVLSAFKKEKCESVCLSHCIYRYFNAYLPRIFLFQRVHGRVILPRIYKR